MKKSIAFLTALCLTASAAAAAVPAAFAADAYDMTVTVDLSADGKAISPYIYGINEYSHQNDLKKVTSTAYRQGGNRMTAYNWETNASNAGSDWKYSSDDNLSSVDTPADCVQQLSKEAAKYGVDYKLTTLQLAGYAAADKDGTVTEAEAAPSARWNEVKLTKGAAFAAEPDLKDGTVYMDEYVNYIINKLGDSQSATGIQGYSLDNEPALWHHTHSRIHAKPVGCEELSEKSIEMATAIKKLDPKAEVFGPALYGYTAYDHLADDETDDEWEKIKADGGYHWYLDYYLDTMKKASEEAGTRLLDVLDIHYYSESSRNGAEDRLQSVRTLYEEGFVENSWIGQWCMENVPILPTVQKSIDTYYPGTKLGITEYNYGGDDDPSGVIAQAEALGCYADAGVYFASLWGGSGYILSGINLYTNYDGKGGKFGDTLLPTKTEDVSKSSAYAAVNKGDESTVTVMITNKNENEAEHATIKLDGAEKDYKKAAVYAVGKESYDIKLVDIVDVSGKTAEVTLPAYCAAMVIISDDADAFANAKQEEKVKKSVVYDDPMDRINANGYVEIPITDPKHLKQITITGDVSSSMGAGWANAGCAVCINAKTAEGKDFWTYKDYMLSLGNGSKAIVEFDGTLSLEDKDAGTKDDVPAYVADGKVELQQWWSASEKGDDDKIEAKYTSIEVIYEYTADEVPAETTTKPAETTKAAETSAAASTTAVSGTTAAGSTTAAGGMKGDANCDNLLTVSDAILAARIAAEDKNAKITDEGKKNADVDGKAGISTEDVTVILQVLAGLAKF